MSRYSIYRCLDCLRKKKRGLLKLKEKGLLCSKCDNFYPFYKKIPVMLSFKYDFYHLKKALSPAKYRVNKF